MLMLLISMAFAAQAAGFMLLSSLRIGRMAITGSRSKNDTTFVVWTLIAGLLLMQVSNVFRVPI